MKYWWRYYLLSFTVLLILSITISNFIPSNFYIEILEVSSIFFIWYLLSPYLMIISFRLSNSNDQRLDSIVTYTSSLFRIKKPKVYMTYTDYTNAFAFGNLFFRGIGYTSSLVTSLQDYELIAVTAHELSHLKNHDMELQVIGLILYDILYIYVSNLNLVLGIVLFALIFPTFLLFHRWLEKRADITAVKNNRWLTRYLENALIKIGYLGRTIPSYLLRDIPDFQLYFIKQQLLSSPSDSMILKTHPSISDRLRYLSQYEI